MSEIKKQRKYSEDEEIKVRAEVRRDTVDYTEPAMSVEAMPATMSESPDMIVEEETIMDVEVEPQPDSESSS
jgi:hypothetical protein